VIVDALAGEICLICFYVYSSIKFLLNIIGNFKKNLIFKISNPPNAPKWSVYRTKLCASCFEKSVSMKKSNYGPRECFIYLSMGEDD